MYKGEGLFEDSSSCRYVGMENGGIGTFAEDDVGSGSVIFRDPLATLALFAVSALDVSKFNPGGLMRRPSETEYLRSTGVVVADRDDNLGRVDVITGIALSGVGVSLGTLFRLSFS